MAKFANKTAILLAILYSQFLLLGYSIAEAHNLFLCFGNVLRFFVWIINSGILTYIFYHIICRGYSFIDTYQASPQKDSLSLTKWFWIFVISKIPYFIACYPCDFDFDAAGALQSLLNPESLACDHHPVFVQFIHLQCFLLGETLGHKSLGFAILTLCFVLVTSGIATYGLRLLKQGQNNTQLTKIAAAIYAFFPLFPYLSVFPTKDGFFSYAFLLYIFTLYELYITQGNSIKKRKFLTLHTIALLMMCLTRHQGIYIIIPECFFLLFIYKNQKKYIAGLYASTIAVFFLYNSILLPHLGVEPGGKQEIYGHPFHQVAYCMKKCPDEISEQDYSFFCTLLGSDTIEKKYYYKIVDPVKRNYKYNPLYRIRKHTPALYKHIDRSNEAEDLARFRELWQKEIFTHPYYCAEASAGVVLGFFYNMGTPLVDPYTQWSTNPDATLPQYTFWHTVKAANWYKKICNKIIQIPIIDWLFAIPGYIWLALFLLSILCHRKDFLGMTVFLPVVLSIGILLICPVAHGRYAFPVVVALPQLFIFVLQTHKKNSQR